MTPSFEKMCQRTGAYSLPWLVRIHDKDNTEALYFINDTQDRVHGGHTYKAATFSYQPKGSRSGFNGGGSLEIAVCDTDANMNYIIDMVETYRIVGLDVVGCLIEDGTVTELKRYTHEYGSVSWDGKKASFSFTEDDRMSMTFPALIFNHYNNRGI